MANRYFVTFDPVDLTITNVALAVTQSDSQYEGYGYCYVLATDELGAFAAALSKIKGQPLTLSTYPAIREG